ncbi:MAG: hypothetical protein WBA74_22855 [Cyclobacteriaceae bacterium]
MSKTKFFQQALIGRYTTANSATDFALKEQLRTPFWKNDPAYPFARRREILAALEKQMMKDDGSNCF